MVEREYLDAGTDAAQAEALRQRRVNARLRVPPDRRRGLARARGCRRRGRIVQRGHARVAATAALAARLAAQSIALPDLDQARSIAREADKLDDSAVTRGALLAALERSPSALGIGRAGEAPLVRFALSPDGHVLATGDTDGVVMFFDADTMRLLGRPYKAGFGVASLAFARHFVAVGLEATGHIALIDPHTHIQARTLNVLNSPSDLALSPDGRTVAVRLSETVEAAHIILYDLASGRERAHRTGLVDGRLAGFTPDGRFVLATTARETLLLDSRTLRLVRRFDGGEWLGSLHMQTSL